MSGNSPGGIGDRNKIAVSVVGETRTVAAGIGGQYSPADGVIVEILVKEGASVTPGAVIARIGASGAAPAKVAAEAAPATARAPVLIAGSVTRALFTRKVKDLEPVDTVSVLTNDKIRITYFTEIHGMAGQTITHRWEFNGKVLLEKKHEVESSRWRAYTSKTLDPTWLGEWKASVVDAAGGTLSVNTFTYMRKSETDVAPVSTAPN